MAAAVRAQAESGVLDRDRPGRGAVSWSDAIIDPTDTPLPPEPSATAPEPSAAAPEPNAAAPEPDVAAPEPNAAAGLAAPVPAAPEAGPAAPEAPSSEPNAAAPATPGTRPAPPAPPPPWPDAAAPLAGAIEGALAIGARAVARLSSQAGGIRFGTVQKLDHQYRAELQSIRMQAGVEGGDPAAVVRRLQALLEQVERFAGQWIPPPAPATATQGAPGPADPTLDAAGAPVPLAVQQVAAIRQGVTRAMIALASAPLHLRLEFGPGFADPHPDVLLLAARMHAIHRAVRGSLKQVCWEAIDRAGLLFGDADAADAVEATFDAQGRLRVPDAVRQNAGRAAAPKSGAAGPRGPGSSTQPRHRDGRAPRPQGGQAGRSHDGQPARSQGGQPARSQPGGATTGRPQPGSSGARPRQGAPAGRAPGPAGGRPTGPSNGPSAPDARQRPATHAAPRPPAGGTPRPSSVPKGGAAPARDDRRASRPRSTFNPLMADKLRAVLAGASAPKPAPTPVDPPAPAAPSGDGSD